MFYDVTKTNFFFLFQTGVPHYEDFINKAAKLHSHLKYVVFM